STRGRFGGRLHGCLHTWTATGARPGPGMATGARGPYDAPPSRHDGQGWRLGGLRIALRDLRSALKHCSKETSQSAPCGRVRILASPSRAAVDCSGRPAPETAEVARCCTKATFFKGTSKIENVSYNDRCSHRTSTTRSLQSFLAAGFSAAVTCVIRSLSS